MKIISKIDAYPINLIHLLQSNLASTRKSTSNLLAIRSKLFYLTNRDQSANLDVIDLLNYINDVQNLLYSFKQDGFISSENMELNPIFKIFRDLYPSHNAIFNYKTKVTLTSIFELEHFHNLIVLLLLLEVYLYLPELKELKKTVQLDDSQEEYITLLDLKRSELIKTLSGGIRITISRKRLRVTERLYTGFDTEYITENSTVNKLLCYTHASLSEVLLTIKNSSVDFSTKEGDVYHPVTVNLINDCIGYIRYLRGEPDFELDYIKQSLLESNTKYDLLHQNNGDLTLRLKNNLSLETVQKVYNDQELDLLNITLEKLLIDVEKIHRDNLNRQRFDLLKLFDNWNLKYSLKKEFFLISHYTPADISFLNDFNIFKDRLNILGKTFVSLDKPLRIFKWKVFLRDTSLLSPSGQSLQSIGSLYEEKLEKISLTKDNLNRMDLFKAKSPDLFKKYALQDALIVLWHSIQVQNSLQQLTGKYSIPITLSSLASHYLRRELVYQGTGRYHPPTLNGNYTMKNISKLYTPIGVELSGSLHTYLDYFLGSYHGGRNESYIYGLIQGVFYDYDLPGAYPTAMSLLNYPDWNKIEVLSSIETKYFLDKYEMSLIKSYTALKINFKFPETVRFPNLPVRLDKNSIIYPLTGTSFCTGLEFLLAHRLGCEIEILGGVFIPFISNGDWKLNRNNYSRNQSKNQFDTKAQDELKNLITDHTKLLDRLWSDIPSREPCKSSYSENYLYLKDLLENDGGGSKQDNSPDVNQFFDVVQKLTLERVKYPKGTYQNLLYKFLANAGIGQMARGLNQKNIFDAESKSTRTLPSGDLISPLYAGWITSFIRTTLSEIMNKDFNAKIISCTTDGFISDKSDLDTLQPSTTDVFSNLYLKARLNLSGEGKLLELKTKESKGVISIRTRGQLGLSGGIKALTGYQRSEPIELTIEKVHKSFNTTKILPFIQTSLRSAKDIFLEGGNSTMKYSERIFNLKFDNRREITHQENGYYHTKPFVHMQNSMQARLIASLGSVRFRLYSPISNCHCRGDAYLALSRRTIVRFLRMEGFSRGEIYNVMKQITLPCTKNFISKQKGLYPILNSLPNTQKIKIILENLSVLFPQFKSNLFLR